MIQIFPKILGTFLFVAFLGLGYSCNKPKQEYPVTITVKYLSDTMKVVPGATVEILKNDVHVVGVTNVKGQFSHTFKLEAILNVNATLDTGAGPVHLYGESTIRLVQEKTANRSVFIAP